MARHQYLLLVEAGLYNKIYVCGREVGVTNSWTGRDKLSIPVDISTPSVKRKPYICLHSQHGNKERLYFPVWPLQYRSELASWQPLASSPLRIIGTRPISHVECLPTLRVTVQSIRIENSEPLMLCESVYCTTAASTLPCGSYRRKQLKSSAWAKREIMKCCKVIE